MQRNPRRRRRPCHAIRYNVYLMDHGLIASQKLPK